MNIATAIRNAHLNGTRAVFDLPNPWKRRRSRLRRRIFLVVGLVVGVFVVAVLLWGLIARGGR